MYDKKASILPITNKKCRALSNSNRNTFAKVSVYFVIFFSMNGKERRCFGYQSSLCVSSPYAFIPCLTAACDGTFALFGPRGVSGNLTFFLLGLCLNNDSFVRFTSNPPWRCSWRGISWSWGPLAGPRHCGTSTPSWLSTSRGGPIK